LHELCVSYGHAREALQAHGADYLAGRSNVIGEQRRLELHSLVDALPPADQCSERECEFVLRSISASVLEDFYGLKMPDGRTLGEFARDALAAADRPSTGPSRKDAGGMHPIIQDLLL
jgi:hypothetical protein